MIHRIVLVLILAWLMSACAGTLSDYPHGLSRFQVADIKSAKNLVQVNAAIRDTPEISRFRFEYLGANYLVRHFYAEAGRAASGASINCGLNCRVSTRSVVYGDFLIVISLAMPEQKVIAADRLENLEQSKDPDLQKMMPLIKAGVKDK